MGVWAAEGTAAKAESSAADAASASDAHTFFNKGDDNDRIRMSIDKTFGNDDGGRLRRVLQVGAPYILSEAPCLAS